VLELLDHPLVAKESNIEAYLISETVLDKFKLAILKTKEFHTVLARFYKYLFSIFFDEIASNMNFLRVVTSRNT
jgi:hypothetical protein